MQEETQKKTNGSITEYEEKRRAVSHFNLTSDMFFGKAMEDRLACQDLIRILTGDRNLAVKEVKTQYAIRNLETHSVVLDVLAEAENKAMICIEIHLGEDEDHIKRSRFNLGCIDVSFLEKGRDYGKIPDVCMIYITEKDFLKGNMGIYKVEKMVCGTHIVASDGVCEIYANLSVEPDDAAQASLLQFIKKSDSFFETQEFPNLAGKVTRLKEEKEEIEHMCEILEGIKAEGIREGIQTGIQTGIELYTTLQRTASVRITMQELNVSEELVRDTAQKFGIFVKD